ncbi:SH3 domain-containing protein [Diplocloster agilis]|uniref:SH3 domain-containing protein n=1 Tax=Diplocloster agilis TaxID=2850323 RepID=A0A949K2P0_9FIRM|nr:SH3 domain-containing protein [Diplocloster agilis]MBU9735426.1 SH3 domain-containing protein [Diplocloster agilis]
MEDFKRFVKNNSRYIILAVILIVLVVVLVKCIGGKDKDKDAKGDKNTENVQPSADPSATPAVTPEDNALLQDAVPEVNDLMNRYYAALAAGDMESVTGMVDTLTDNDAGLPARSEWIDSYNNISCYTKKGLTDNSYVVYTYFEIKFVGDKTASMAPGLSSFYVAQNDQGAYYILQSSNPDVENYMANITKGDDVQALVASVNQKWEEIKAGDPTVAEVATLMINAGETADGGEADGEAGAEQPEEQQPEEEAPAEQPAEEPAAGVQDVDETVYATDSVNIRSDANETAERVGQVYKGETLHRTGILDSGWSRVDYNGQTAYVKSEYVTTDANSANGGGEDNSQASVTPAGGTATAKESVSFREGMSETSAKQGVIYQGEKVKKIMDYAEGWSKVEYNGKTGYVKTEYLN